MHKECGSTNWLPATIDGWQEMANFRKWVCLSCVVSLSWWCLREMKRTTEVHFEGPLNKDTHVGIPLSRLGFPLRCHMAVVQSQWYHFGVGAILVHLSGDWDVHYKYDLALNPWPYGLVAPSHPVP